MYSTILLFFNRNFEPADHMLAGIMSDYWVNFMKKGDPNGNGLPKWPSFNAVRAEVMILSEKPGAAMLPGKAGLDFLYSRTQLK